MILRHVGGGEVRSLHGYQDFWDELLKYYKGEVINRINLGFFEKALGSCWEREGGNACAWCLQFLLDWKGI